MNFLRSVLLLAAASVLSACASTTPSPTPGSDAEQIRPPTTAGPAEQVEQFVPTFEASQCPMEFPEGAPVECGYVVVPEDHHNPAGPTLRLATVIVKDSGENHQPDPVILLAGGPGERVVANVFGLAPVLSALHPNRDLIFFDQRGVGKSEPALECPEFIQAMFETLDEAEANQAVKTVYDGFMACRDRLQAEGHNLGAYTTNQNAADVEAIRLALGYDALNLYGGSYGSLLAQAVMRDHPDHIRSVALNSTLPLQKSLFVDAYSTTAHAILRLVDACVSEAACNETYPDLQAVLFEVIDRLNADPVPMVITNPLDGQSYDALLTGDAVRANLVTFLYITDIIPVLPQAIYEVYNGDAELMKQLSSTRLALLDQVSRGMMASVICEADFAGRTTDDLIDIIASLPKQLTSSADPQTAVDYGMYGICQNWPVPQADSTIKTPLVSDIPTLIVEGEFDPVTPPEYGRLVAGYLSNGYYFEFPGVGHDVLANSCARELAGEFIADPSKEPTAACFTQQEGVAFDLPRASREVVLEAFIDEQRGFQGLIPVGWEELAPANLARKETALDPTYFVLEASQSSAQDLFNALVGQLRLDPIPDPIASSEIGNFVWDLYQFDRPGGQLADLAIAGFEGTAYFVYMVTAPDEHQSLFSQLFLPAVEAMAPAG